MRVAVVGAGWAGMAAAVALTQAGHHVTVMEAARTLGGRARALHTVDAAGQPLVLDNGQHILIGAYTETLRLMRTVGVDVPSAMLRLPLTLTYADRSGLELPDLPPPWDALVGVARARGWSWTDKVALLRTCASWQLKGFRCDARWSVAQLCESLPQRLLQPLWEQATAHGLRQSALVSVQGSEGYWQRHGYVAQPLHQPEQQQRLASYGEGAVYMARTLQAK